MSFKTFQYHKYIPANESRNVVRLNGKLLLRFAMIFGLMTHGIIVYTTLPKTYDAFVHLFFADHYSRFWFEPWEYRWYTGFSVYGYPPLVHQSIALIGKIFPFKVSIAIYAIVIMEFLIIGTYRFTALFYDKITSGISAILIVIFPSFIQTLHVFGQLPTLTGIAFLLNSLPFLYKYLYFKRSIFIWMSLLFLSLVICSHHVTMIFGLFFFVVPLLYMVLYDTYIRDYYKFPAGLANVFNFIKYIFSTYKYLLIYFVTLFILVIFLIFPYWYNSINDPIKQISIPHGSRDNYLLNRSSGLVFFVIPLITFIAFIPSILYQIYKYPRFLFWGFSMIICFVLGAGGTTPLPRMILGDNAFNILTFDRFAFWCSIISIPFISKYIKELFIGSIKKNLILRHGIHFLNFLIISITTIYFIFILFIFHLSFFKPLQPKEIDIYPIVNFLNRDEHMDWRYLTLGFGDQMAWLSLNTLAATVDGNYHSSRRLPELTTRPVERLENAKYLGDHGLAALNDFLIKAEKYNLRYVFSNDQFYDPLLFYTGWNRVSRLVNGIMVWEKNNIPKVNTSAKKKISSYLDISWGIIPMMMVSLCVISSIFYVYYYNNLYELHIKNERLFHFPISIAYVSSLLPVSIYLSFLLSQIYELSLNREMSTPSATISNFYKYQDLQKFEQAFSFYPDTLSYTLDQFLLEKSITDGGLIPSYGKLDTINITSIDSAHNTAIYVANAKWNTSVGKRMTNDTIELRLYRDSWKIIPKSIPTDINPNQIDSYQYILFKKNGKRVISTFPTVYDDRIKKAFVQYNQVDLIYNNGFYIIGEIMNSDDVPINILVKAIVNLKNGDSIELYTNKNIIYNLAPKGKTFFKINLDSELNHYFMDDILDISIYTQTDISDRGYLHGGPIEVSKQYSNQGRNLYEITFYNDMVSDITIPGVMIAHRNESGQIIDTELMLFNNSIGSGLSRKYTFFIQDQVLQSKIITHVPIKLFINNQERIRNVMRLKDTLSPIPRYSFLPHCFMAKEIYLQ